MGDIDDFGERTQIRSRIKELRDQEDLDVPDYPDARRLSEGLEAYYMDERGRRRSSLIDRAALEEMNKEAAVSAENVNYDEIEDPAELEKLVSLENLKGFLNPNPQGEYPRNQSRIARKGAFGKRGWQTQFRSVAKMWICVYKVYPGYFIFIVLIKKLLDDPLLYCCKSSPFSRRDASVKRMNCSLIH